MSYESDMTIEYYETNADAFVDGTIAANMDELRTRFLQYVPDGGAVLDFGCGSGRDSKAFLDAGYRVTPLDGSAAICAKATELLDQPVICCEFQNYKAFAQYDGIWACASLLHLTENELNPVLYQLIKSIKPNGVLYMSFKYGDQAEERNGRWFTDMNERRLTNVMKLFRQVNMIEQWVSEDVRLDRSEKWLNAIYQKI